MVADSFGTCWILYLALQLYVEKQKGESLGVVIVESGWGSILPTVILASMLNSGPAARSGKLSVGDQIMSINDTSLVGLPLATCQGIIKVRSTRTFSAHWLFIGQGNVWIRAQWLSSRLWHVVNSLSPTLLGFYGDCQSHFIVCRRLLYNCIIYMRPRLQTQIGCSHWGSTEWLIE